MFLVKQKINIEILWSEQTNRSEDPFEIVRIFFLLLLFMELNHIFFFLGTKGARNSQNFACVRSGENLHPLWCYASAWQMAP